MQSEQLPRNTVPFKRMEPNFDGPDMVPCKGKHNFNTCPKSRQFCQLPIHVNFKSVRGLLLTKSHEIQTKVNFQKWHFNVFVPIGNGLRRDLLECTATGSFNSFRSKSRKIYFENFRVRVRVLG